MKPDPRKKKKAARKRERDEDSKEEALPEGVEVVVEEAEDEQEGPASKKDEDGLCDEAEKWKLNMKCTPADSEPNEDPIDLHVIPTDRLFRIRKRLGPKTPDLDCLNVYSLKTLLAANRAEGRGNRPINP